VQLVLFVLEDRRRLAEILSSVFRSTPQGIALEVVSFDRAKQEMSLRGAATSTQEVLEYIQQLEHLDGVESASLKYSTQRSTQAGERTDFEIVLAQKRLPG
jgi:Tfp pilus assembly protein PilN